MDTEHLLEAVKADLDQSADWYEESDRDRVAAAIASLRRRVHDLEAGIEAHRNAALQRALGEPLHFTATNGQSPNERLWSLVDRKAAEMGETWRGGFIVPIRED